MKLITVDLDGILMIKKKKRASEWLRQLNRLEEHNLVAVATKQSLSDTRMILETETTGPVVASNGAMIYDSDGHLMDGTPMDRHQVTEIARYALAHHVYFELLTAEGMLSPSTGEAIFKRELTYKQLENPALRTEKLRRDAQKRLSHVTLKSVEAVEAAYETGKPVFKIRIASFFSDILDRFEERFPATRSIVQVRTPVSIEFMTDKIDKGIGVRRLAAAYRIQEQDVVALGANPEDLPVFQAAGIKVVSIREQTVDTSDISDASAGSVSAQSAEEAYCAIQ